MKYKLINTETKEETLCDKVIIDGFEYYFLLEKYKGTRSYFYDKTHNLIMNNVFSGSSDGNIFDIVACNNPNIDVPRVVDKAELLAKNIYRDNPTDKKGVSYKYNTDINAPRKRKAFVKGYHKSQETHPFSEEDMIEFYRWLNKNSWQDYNDIKQGLFVNSYGVQKQDKELLQIWKEQKLVKIYYVD